MKTVKTLLKEQRESLTLCQVEVEVEVPRLFLSPEAAQVNNSSVRAERKVRTRLAGTVLPGRALRVREKAPPLHRDRAHPVEIYSEFIGA